MSMDRETHHTPRTISSLGYKVFSLPVESVEISNNLMKTPETHAAYSLYHFLEAVSHGGQAYEYTTPILHPSCTVSFTGADEKLTFPIQLLLGPLKKFTPGTLQHLSDYSEGSHDFLTMIEEIHHTGTNGEFTALYPEQHEERNEYYTHQE